MPVPNPPKGITQVAIHGTFGPAEWTNVFHTMEETPSDPSSSNVHNLAQNYFDGWVTSWLGFHSDQVVVVGCDVVHYGTDGEQVVGSYSNPSIGEDSGVELPASSAMVISERIAAHYKGGHPRLYICGLAQDRLEDTKTFSAATVAEAQTAAETWKALVDGATIGAGNHTLLVCLRRFADGGSLTVPKTYLDPPTVHPVTAVIARLHVGSQRRRLGRF